MKKISGIVCGVIILVIAAGGARAEEKTVPAEEKAWQWGRYLEDQRTFSLELTGGKITSFEGTVKETVRPYYEVIGQEAQGETYTLSDLGLNGQVGIFGGAIEQKWKYLTLGLNGAYFRQDADQDADQNFYIGVNDEIEYQGKEYEYLKIPQGDRYVADAKLGICELKALITPFTFRPSPHFQVVPWAYLGVVGIFGRYDLDAGPPRGTEIYEDPPREYVIGGQTDGWAGIGIPGIGGGGEIALGSFDGIRLVLSGNFAFLDFHGSTKYIPINVRHEKDLDLYYRNYELKGLLEVPLSPETDLIFGIAYNHIHAAAAVKSQAESPEEIIAEREKWDKDIDFNYSSVTGILGLKF